MTGSIGVGVVGASVSSPGWATTAHIPAIRALPDFALRAVSTSSPASAAAAAEAFGVPAFADAESLIAHPGVDLVVVAVKVTDHDRIIAKALEAKKMVFSEWPLARNLAEATDLARLAALAGVRTAIGLQGRFAPAVRHARKLVGDGFVGEVLATTLVGSGIAWAGETDHAHRYMFDVTTGANLLSVPTLHALDVLIHVLGEFTSVTATVAVRRRTIRVADDHASLTATAPDHAAIAGILEGGAVASVFYRGGVSRGANLHWEINGTDGDLVLSSDVGNLQVADLKLEGGRGADRTVSAIALPASYAEAPGGLSAAPGANVLRLYTALAQDIRSGTREVPDFAHALRRHRLLAAIETAAAGTASRISL